MTKYLIPLLSFTILFSSSLNAQQPDPVKGKEILQKTVQYYKSHNSSKVVFDYIIENRMDDEETKQEGVFYLKGDKFKLTIGDQTIVTNNKKIWTYLEDVNEVQINLYNPEELEINPAKLFTMWETGYLYGYVGDSRLNNDVIHILDLTPEDKEQPYYKVRLYIRKNDKEIVRMQTFYKNQGIILTFDIKSYESGVNLRDEVFEFDTSKYPKIEIIDLTQ